MELGTEPCARGIQLALQFGLARELIIAWHFDPEGRTLERLLGISQYMQGFIYLPTEALRSKLHFADFKMALLCLRENSG